MQHDQRTSTPVSGYSADTEILTRRNGWVTFDRLTYLDEVATRVNGQFTWEHPASITWRPYQGDMIAFRNRTVDLMVTPGTPVPHLNRVRERDAAGRNIELAPVERTLPAASIPPSGAGLIATSTWEPSDTPSRFEFTPRPVRADGKRNTGRPPSSFQGSVGDFAAFMGMYLAEGNCSTGRLAEYSVWIWQDYGGRGYAEYQALLDGLLGRPVPWHKNKDGGGWHFKNKGLWEYLKTCGGYAHDKRVPPEILGLPPEYLERFWHHYWLGDGTTMVSPGRKPVEVVSTASRVMADNLQEILQKLGGWALIQVIDHGKYPSKLGRTNYPTHRLIRRASPAAYVRNPQRVPYDGMAGHAETGVGPVYVRRNYRPVWAGA